MTRLDPAGAQPEPRSATEYKGDGSLDLAIVGGCGHVGLPLGLALAEGGMAVGLLDVNAAAVESVNGGHAPFDEPGLPEVLARVLSTGRLTATTDPVVVKPADIVVVVIGTPIDAHMNPDLDAMQLALEEITAHLRDGPLLVLRDGAPRRTQRGLQPVD